MPQSSRKHQSYSSDSSSDDSTSSSSTCSETQYQILINKKHHNKHDSDSDSDSDVEQHRKKHNDHRRKHKKSSKPSKPSKPSKSSKPTKCNKPKPSDSCTESDIDFDKFSFDNIYKYYKCELLKDPSLMVAGSDSYIYAYNNTELTIPTNSTIDFNNNGLQYNLEHKYTTAPFVVKKDGIYIIFFTSSSDQSVQYTVFVNGLAVPSTTSGNNAGAGQTVSRQLIQLKKNDTVFVRNYQSAVPAITSHLNTGGLQTGNNEVILFVKIAPLPNSEYECIEESWKSDCLTRRKRHLFRKLAEKLSADKQLMLQGFNIYGSYYNNTPQIVNTEYDVVFSTSNTSNGLTWSPSNGSQVIIQEDGIYKIFFFANTPTPGQFSFSVNGVPYEPSTHGSNRGAGQISLRTLLELKAGDVVSVKNHTSGNGSITLSGNSGGFQNSLSTILTIFKIAPIVKPDISCCIPKGCHYKNYELFRSFLLSNKCLQLMGSSAYSTMNTTHEQIVSIGNSFDLEVNILNKDIDHNQGTSEVVIKKTGIYDIFADVITHEAAQFTIFVNGIPNITTTAGRDSGANRSIIRQIMQFNSGDVITVRNWESYAGLINTATNSGGSQIGHPIKFMLFLLYENDNNMEWCFPPIPPPPPVCLPEPPNEEKKSSKCSKKSKPSKPSKKSKSSKKSKCSKKSKSSKKSKGSKKSKCENTEKPEKPEKVKKHNHEKSKHKHHKHHKKHDESSDSSDNHTKKNKHHKSHKK